MNVNEKQLTESLWQIIAKATDVNNHSVEFIAWELLARYDIKEKEMPADLEFEGLATDLKTLKRMKNLVIQLKEMKSTLSTQVRVEDRAALNKYLNCIYTFIDHSIGDLDRLR